MEHFWDWMIRKGFVMNSHEGLYYKFPKNILLPVKDIPSHFFNFYKAQFINEELDMADLLDDAGSFKYDGPGWLEEKLDEIIIGFDYEEK